MVSAKISYSCKPSLFLMLLYQVNAIEIICPEYNGKSKTFDISTASDNKAAKMGCFGTSKVSLVNGSVLYLTGKEVTTEFGWFLNTNNLAMCVVIENTGITSAFVSVNHLTGSCEGPRVSIINNPHLARITMNHRTVEAMKKSVPYSIRIRGNKKLSKDFISITKDYTAFANVTIDLQTFGECDLPKPFVSFKGLDRSCSKFYGVLTLNQGTTEIRYDPTKLHEFEIESCIQIEKTDLKDITFLSAFPRFKPIPLCRQYIRDNKNLCSKNLNYLNSYFGSVDIFNNSNHACNECMGGRVSEEYTNESVNCSFIYGDLVIAHLRGLPRHIDNLRTIETIEGRLIIFNNTGLGKFTYLSSLQRVGIKKENEVAIIVKDNPDLKALPMQKLVDISFKEDTRVEIVNNPMLTEEMEKKLTDGSVLEQFDKNRISSALEEGLTKHFGLFISLMCVAFAALAVSLYGTFLRKRKRNLRLPQLPYGISRNSKGQLVHLCMEILTKNPLVWSVEDLNFLRKEKIACDSSKQAELIQSCMVPVTRNGKISQRVQTRSNKCLRNRVEEMLKQDVVVMIGTTPNVSDVIPGLPKAVGHISRYEGGAVFRLLEVTQISSMSTRYKYEVKNDGKNTVKCIDIVLFCWLPEQLPTEFSELLQLAVLVRGRKAVCTSNRRKEVFSMLYVFYASVIKAKGPQSAVKVFQLHSLLCNGAPLDRREMLYIMRILLEWARGAKCVPAEFEQKCSQWCQTYEQMANFTRKHTNIINMHPLQLPRLDCVEALNKEVVAAKNRVTNLSERPFAIVSDRFRRKTPEEIKQDMINTTKTITDECNYAAKSTIETNAHNIDTLKFFAKDQVVK